MKVKELKNELSYRLREKTVMIVTEFENNKIIAYKGNWNYIPLKFWNMSIKKRDVKVSKDFERFITIIEVDDE